MQKTFELYKLTDEKGKLFAAIGLEEVGPLGQMDITGEKYYAHTPAGLAGKVKRASRECERVENIILKTEHSHPLKLISDESGLRCMWASPFEYGDRQSFHEEWSTKRSTERE